MKKSIKLFSIIISSIIFSTCFFQPILAYVMSSTNYKIQSDDSLTPEGGVSATADGNYIFHDTMGEPASGVSSSNSYKIKAGYQQMQEVSLSVTSSGDANLTPAIPGVSGGTADANVHWTVQTDSASGFDMKISSSTAPALKNGSYYFDDYATTPTYNWNIGSNAAKFGFAVVPATSGDAVLAFKDNGAGCGSGNNIGNCWAGLGTTPVQIINRATRTDAAGENETINFKAQSNKLLQSGNYSATITVTVSPN